MRAYYANHKHTRLFVLGTPEGWHIGFYDLQNQRWMPFDLPIQQTLKEAKACAQQKVAPRLGSRVPDLRWF